MVLEVDGAGTVRAARAHRGAPAAQAPHRGRARARTGTGRGGCGQRVRASLAASPTNTDPLAAGGQPDRAVHHDLQGHEAGTQHQQLGGHLPRDGSTNCGSSATVNNAIFGFSTLVTSPHHNARRVLGAPPLPSAACRPPRARRLRTPSHSR